MSKKEIQALREQLNKDGKNEDFVNAVCVLSGQLGQAIQKLDDLCVQKIVQQNSDDQFRIDWETKTRKESKVSKATLFLSGIAAGAGLATLLIDAGLASAAWQYLVDCYVKWWIV